MGIVTTLIRKALTSAGQIMQQVRIFGPNTPTLRDENISLCLQFEYPKDQEMERVFMLNFTDPLPCDADRVRRLAEEGSACACELSFANMFLLRQKYGISIAVQNGFLFRYYRGNKRLSGYGFPIGSGDPSAAVQEIFSDAEHRNRAPSFCLLSNEQKEYLNHFYPDQFEFITNRGDSDYLYAREDLVQLSGRAYHRKRNFIVRFEKNYPNWRFVPIRSENRQDALEVERIWFEEHNGDSDPDLLLELETIRESLRLFDELRLHGGIIYIGARPCAMGIASGITREICDIHYEKTVSEFRNAYPLLNRELARMLTGYQFVNFEEDLNIPGLRTAKLSYFPKILLEKSSAVFRPSTDHRLTFG